MHLKMQLSLSNSFNPDSSARDLYIGNNVDGYSCAECDFLT